MSRQEREAVCMQNKLHLKADWMMSAYILVHVAASVQVTPDNWLHGIHTISRNQAMMHNMASFGAYQLVDFRELSERSSHYPSESMYPRPVCVCVCLYVCTCVSSGYKCVAIV